MEPFRKAELFLRRRLDRTECGERVTTVRECMKECQVSKAVVDRAAVFLQGERLLEIRPRSGLYKPSAETVKKPLAILLHFQRINFDNRSFHGDVMYYLSREFSRRGWDLKIHTMSCESDPGQVVKDLTKRKNVDCVIAVSVAYHDMKYIEQLQRSGIRVLLLFPNMAETMPGSLNMDDAAIVRMQLEHLTDAGIRKIAFLHAVDETRYIRSQNRRLEAFCRQIPEFQLQVRPEWICNIGWFPDTIQPAVRALLAAKDRPEALIVNDAQSGSVYTAIRQMKLTIGEDISVVGCDDLEYVKYFDPPLATVAIDRQRVAEHLCRLIEQVDFSGAEFIRLEFKTRPSIRQRMPALADNF